MTEEVEEQDDPMQEEKVSFSSCLSFGMDLNVAFVINMFYICDG